MVDELGLTGETARDVATSARVDGETVIAGTCDLLSGLLTPHRATPRHAGR
jgi:hypothetical protein